MIKLTDQIAISTGPHILCAQTTLVVYMSDVTEYVRPVFRAYAEARELKAGLTIVVRSVGIQPTARILTVVL